MEEKFHIREEKFQQLMTASAAEVSSQMRMQVQATVGEAIGCGTGRRCARGAAGLSAVSAAAAEAADGGPARHKRGAWGATSAAGRRARRRAVVDRGG
jgi:hypothetical protein